MFMSPLRPLRPLPPTPMSGSVPLSHSFHLAPWTAHLGAYHPGGIAWYIFILTTRYFRSIRAGGESVLFMAAFFLWLRKWMTHHKCYINISLVDESMYSDIFQKQEDSPRRTSVFLGTTGWERGESADLTRGPLSTSCLHIPFGLGFYSPEDLGLLWPVRYDGGGRGSFFQNSF